MRQNALLLSLTICAIACEDDALQASAGIEVVPETIDFAQVPTGESRTVELAIRNPSSTAPLVIGRLELAPGSSAAFELGPAPSEVAPRGEVRVAVRFLAADGEPDAGHVVIESNAQGKPRVLVPLSSARTEPQLHVDPDRLDLGPLATGDSAGSILTASNAGLDTLHVHRLSIRTLGYQGEACRDDGDCRRGRCLSSSSGKICAEPCTAGACAEGYDCTPVSGELDSCLEAPGTRAPTSARGFRLTNAAAFELAPGAASELQLDYAPLAQDRGAAQLVIESSDPERPFLQVPLLGRPEDLPPVAAVTHQAPSPLGPGSIVSLDGRGSHDPEGSALAFRWSFVRRPEGSHAAFDDARGSTTRFTIDLPGTYLAALEVRDDGGLSSTNDARAEVTAGAGRRVQVSLQWDRADTDLDLHLVAPGSAVGSSGDCFFDNPTPDWPPLGPGGDPTLTSSTAREQIEVEAPADGVYTVVVRVAAPSPQGAAGAQVRISLDGVEAARFDATLPTDKEQWDVATISRPSGRVISLGTIR